MSLLSLFISILPVFLLGRFVYKKDKNKESSNLIAKLFIGGIGSCFLTFFVSSLMSSFFPFFIADTKVLNLSQLLIYVFIGIALVEEGSKWFFAYKISYYHEEFDELYDMILYCTLVSLGFACFENILYVFDTNLLVGVTRAFLSVPGHACNGVFMGYYLGLSKLEEYQQNKKMQKKYLIMSIVIPTITHGIYDYCLLSELNILILLFFIFVIWMYFYTFKRLKKVSENNRLVKYKNRYCTNCGSPVIGDYCNHCGRKNE